MTADTLVSSVLAEEQECALERQPSDVSCYKESHSAPHISQRSNAGGSPVPVHPACYGQRGCDGERAESEVGHGRRLAPVGGRLPRRLGSSLCCDANRNAASTNIRPKFDIQGIDSAVSIDLL